MLQKIRLESRQLNAFVEKVGIGAKTNNPQFVRDLVAKVDEQGKKWYGSRNMKVPMPTRFPTPYGGRLVWTLPGQTKIICHLKDKNKIRHKKRWSQCMYMYYFLGENTFGCR